MTQQRLREVHTFTHKLLINTADLLKFIYNIVKLYWPFSIELLLELICIPTYYRGNNIVSIVRNIIEDSIF